MDACYKKKTVLVPYRRFFNYRFREDDPREKYPFFKVYDVAFGTKGYKYLLVAWDNSQGKWIRWPGVYVHTDVEKNFRIATQAEHVLYGPF